MAGITSCRLQTTWICGIIVDVVAVVNQETHVASETASWKSSASMVRCMW